MLQMGIPELHPKIRLKIVVAKGNLKRTKGPGVALALLGTACRQMMKKKISLNELVPSNTSLVML